MTEVQIWSIAAAALVAALLIAVVAVRRHRKRAHPHGHIVVDMTVPRAGSAADPLTHDATDRAVGSDTKEI
jgi:hypothetical protein